MSNEDSLAGAHARLLARSGRVTVRALKAEAGVSTDAAAVWLRHAEPAPETPAPPDLGAAVKIVWAMAWQFAYTEARKFTEDEVLGARAREAEALERADNAAAQAEAAKQAQEQAQTHATAAESLVAGLEASLTQAREQLTTVERTSRELETARTRAEAEADALRVILTDLRGDLRASLHRPE